MCKRLVKYIAIAVYIGEGTPGASGSRKLIAIILQVSFICPPRNAHSMRLPSLHKRTPSPTATTSTSLPTETYVSSSSVVSAISRLNDTITKLKLKNRNLTASLGACVGIVAVLAVMLFLALIFVLFRVLNRKRAAQGLDPLKGTAWMMFPLGPSLNGGGGNGAKKANALTAQREVIGSDAKLAGNPYAVQQHGNSANGVGIFPSKFAPSPSSANSNETFVAVGTELSSSKVNMLNAETYPLQYGSYEATHGQGNNNSNNHSHHNDNRSISESQQLSPNVNRYTIDIEYQPYAKPKSELDKRISSGFDYNRAGNIKLPTIVDADKNESTVSHLHWKPKENNTLDPFDTHGNVANNNTHIDQKKNSVFTNATSDYEYPPQDIYPPQLHPTSYGAAIPLDSENPYAVGAGNGNKAENKDLYDDFNSKPPPPFLMPNSKGTAHNRQSVVSSVYDISGKNEFPTPDIELSNKKY